MPRRALLSRARAALAVQAAATGLGVGLSALAPVLFGLRYQGVDHSRILLAMQCAVRRGLDHGLALDPALGGGSPLLAEPQSGVFYPATWLLLPFPAEAAASLYVVLHLALAAAGAVLLAASFRLRPQSRVALGLAYPLCGSVLNLVLHGPFLAAAAWLPWAWVGARWVLGVRHRRAGVLVAGSALALTLLSGDPQGFGIAVALLALEACVAVVRRRPARRAGLLAGPIVAALLVGGLQLAPTLGLRQASARARGASQEFVESWPLAAPEIFGIVWPLDSAERVRGGASLRTAWLGDPLVQPAWNTTPLLGLAAIAAALAGWRLRKARVPAIAALVLTVFSLGAQTPVFPIAVRLLPLLGWFRYPSRYFVAASLAALIVAACTFDRAARPRARRRGLVVALGAATLCSGAVLAVVAARTSAIDALATKVANAAGQAAAGLPLLSSASIRAGALATAMGALALLLVALRPRWSPLALALPLLAAFPERLPLDVPILAAPAARASLGGPDQALLCHGRHLQAIHVDLPDEPLGVRGDLLPDFHDLLPQLQLCGGPAVPQWYLASAQAETVSLVRERLDEESGALGPAVALGCTHLVTRSPRVLPGFVPAEDAPPLAFLGRLYSLIQPLPAAALAADPVLLASGAEAVERVASLNTAAEVSRLLDDPAGSLGSAKLPTASSARLSGASFGAPTQGRIELEGTGGAVVVLRKPWWPGWEARQAGANLPVLRAAGVQLAVVVADASAGPIELTYRAPLLAAGFASGASGLLALAGLALLARRRPRR